MGAEPASSAASRCEELASVLYNADVSEIDLVHRAKNGDRFATDELFRRYYQRAFRLAYTLCSGDREEAKDALQDAFIKAFRNLGKFNEGAAFYTWLFRIVVNTCIDRTRGIKRWKRLFSFWPSSGQGNEQHDKLMEVQDERSESSPISKLEGKEMGERIRGAVMKLPKNQRLVFYLKVVEGMKIKEIAQTTGSAEGTIKSHLFRAIHTLQSSLKDLTEGE